jgi:glyoxylase-like metal-dependent hydrolase (beta-lactamase superfamily II)
MEMRIGKWVLCGALAALIAAGSASAQSFDIVKVADGVYAAIGRAGVASNGAFVVTDDEVLVVDTHYRPSWARDLIAEIKKVTDKPVRFVVNTHWHNDHVQGNEAYLNVFGRNVEYLAQHSAREDMANKAIPSIKDALTNVPRQIENLQKALAAGTDLRGQPLDDAGRTRVQGQIESLKDYLEQLKQLQITLPTMTFERSLILHRRGRAIHVYYFGKGHTRGDVVVYLPKERVVVTGDLLTNGIPFTRDAYPSHWAGTLEAIQGLDWEFAIPGHGGVQTGKDQIGKLIAYMKDMVAAVKEAVAKGMSLDDAKKSIDMSRHSASFPNFQGGNQSAIERAWAELTGKIPD